MGFHPICRSNSPNYCTFRYCRNSIWGEFDARSCPRSATSQRFNVLAIRKRPLKNRDRNTQAMRGDWFSIPSVAVRRRRSGPKGRVQDARAFSSVQDVLSKTPAPAHEPAKRARTRGVLSFGYCFFGQAKKSSSTSPKAMSKALAHYFDTESTHMKLATSGR